MGAGSRWRAGVSLHQGHRDGGVAFRDDLCRRRRHLPQFGRRADLDAPDAGRADRQRLPSGRRSRRIVHNLRGDAQQRHENDGRRRPLDQIGFGPFGPATGLPAGSGSGLSYQRVRSTEYTLYRWHGHRQEYRRGRPLGVPF